MIAGGGLGKLLSASAAAFTSALAMVSDGLSVPHAFEWIVGILLAIIGALLLGAWNDLKKRDEDSRRDRKELYQKVDRVNQDIARLQERLRLYDNGHERGF